MVAPVCFVDTECTGLDPDRHEIWEVGLIVNGTEYRWFLPVDLGRADPIALNIGRFHDRYRKSEVTPLDCFASDFARLTRGLHLVGAVVSFDAERLAKLLRANGQCAMWHYHLCDVEALAAGWIAAQCVGQANDGVGRGTISVHLNGDLIHLDGRPPWKSDELAEAVGVKAEDFIEGKHTALGDARWAQAIYEAVMSS